jgi:phosphoglucosamine mutase
LRKGKKASDLFNVFESTPQILENIVVKDKNIITHSKIKQTIKKANRLIKNNGRLLVRKSGTESKIRIMGESKNRPLLQKCIQMIKQSIK